MYPWKCNDLLRKLLYVPSDVTMVISLFIIHYIIKTSNNFNFYMLVCANNTLKQEIVHYSMAYYVQVRLYKAAKHV
jgi:hypothetical protein